MNAVVIRSFDSTFDPRTWSIVNAFSNLGIPCSVIDWSIESSPPNFTRFKRERLFSRGFRNINNHLLFNLWLGRQLILLRPKVVVCIDTENFIGVLLYKATSLLFRNRTRIILDVADPLHSKLRNLQSQKFLQCFELLCFMVAEHVVFPSQNRVPKRNMHNYIVIENSFLETSEIEALRRSHKESNSVFYGGLLLKDRGLDLLLSLASNPELNVVIAGYGELEEYIESSVQDNPKIDFLGKVNFNDLSNLRARHQFSWCWYNQEVPENLSHASGKILESLLVGSIPITNVTPTSLPSWYHDLGTRICFVDENNFHNRPLQLIDERIGEPNLSFLSSTQEGYRRLLGNYLV